MKPQPPISIIQRQEWTEFTRYIIANTHASVILELFPDKQWFGGTAYIYSLYVQPQSRRQGHARTLLNLAQEIARGEGHKSIHLHYCSDDTPRDILRWYRREGFRTCRTFVKNISIILKKSLKPKQLHCNGTKQ